MNQIILNGINVDELLEKFGEIIDQRLAKLDKSSTTKESNSLLSRTEVCALLKISLPTLNDWTKRGLLQSYKIGNRVLYKAKEIETAIDKNMFHKHNRVR